MVHHLWSSPLSHIIPMSFNLSKRQGWAVTKLSTAQRGWCLPAGRLAFCVFGQGEPVSLPPIFWMSMAYLWHIYVIPTGYLWDFVMIIDDHWWFSHGEELGRTGTGMSPFFCSSHSSLDQGRGIRDLHILGTHLWEVFDMNGIILLYCWEKTTTLWLPYGYLMATWPGWILLKWMAVSLFASHSPVFSNAWRQSRTCKSHGCWMSAFIKPPV